MIAYRHRAIWATWVIILLLLALVIAVGLYTRTTLRSVEQTLPTILLDQLEDLSLVTEGMGRLVAAADLARRAPDPESIQALLREIDTVFEDLLALRDTYVFDNLVQASAFHSVIAPALVDARQWLTHGVSGHPPDTSLNLNIVHSRLHDALLKASDVRYASHDMAQAILVEQRQRLERFLVGVNLLLVLTALISAVVLGLMLRQHRLLRSEAATQAERRRLIAIIESTNDLISQAMLDGRLIYLNSSGRNLVGWQKDESLAGKRINQLHPQWALDLIQGAGIPAALRNGAWSGETALLHRNGTVFPVMQIIMAHKDANGRPEFLSTIIHDISARKQAELEREKMQSQLLQAQKMESIGILAGGVAHDFNNLLHAMRGNIEILLRDMPAHAAEANRLQAITRSMDRATLLVQQLLLFGRKNVSREVRVDLNQEVKNVIQILERTIPKMISLELHLDPIAWPLYAEPMQIEQILLNLAGNAVDAMPEGGRLIIETSNVQLDEDFLKVHPGAALGRHVLLTVTDTGCGMDKNILAHVFDPFFTTKEVGKGTGLGLSSVYGIAKAHGGYIQCYSEPGAGSTFRVYLPVAQQDQAPERDASADTPPPGGNETVLVVDDDSEIRELTRESLEMLGYSVIMAATGEQALDVYHEQGAFIELVLLDLNMPGMGGGKCLQKLLLLDPQVRVVIASGYTASGHGKDALASGAKGFIGKPYQLGQLAATVRKVLDG